MYRAPARPERNLGRFPSPSSAWFPGEPSPYRVSGNRGQSPGYSPRSNQRSWNGSPARFNGSRGFGGSPRYRRGGFGGPRSFSPGSSPKFQVQSSDHSIEKYFSPSMLKDPWAELQPIRNITI